MDHPWKLNLTVRSLILAGIVAVTSLPGDGAGAEPQPEPAAEKGVAGSDGPADSPETRVATVLGRNVLRKDLEPPPKWLEDREKHLKLHGETPGLVPLDTYRMNKLHEAVWEPLRQKYCGCADVRISRIMQRASQALRCTCFCQAIVELKGCLGRRVRAISNSGRDGLRLSPLP